MNSTRDGQAATHTHRQDYPAVDAWLRGASPAHPWVQLLEVVRSPDSLRPSAADALLNPLAQMITALEDTQPPGLASARARFKNDLDKNLLATRLELLCGAHLARQHIRFGFGGPGQPDIVWDGGTAQEGWLEIHRSDVDGFSRLRSAIAEELEPRKATLQIRVVSWPLEVRDRNLVLQRISEAADRAIAAGQQQIVELPELGAQAIGVVSNDDVASPGIGRVTVEHSGAPLKPSAAYLQTLASGLVERIEEKASQARRGRWGPQTALLIDISPARYTSVLGRGDLAAWLLEIPIDWSDNPYAGVAVSLTDLQSVSLAGLSRYRPQLETSIRDRIEPTLSSIGLTTV